MHHGWRFFVASGVVGRVLDGVCWGDALGQAEVGAHGWRTWLPKLRVLLVHQLRFLITLFLTLFLKALVPCEWVVLGGGRRWAHLVSLKE